MKADKEGFSIVILGAWNKNIFTVEWLTRELEIKLPINISVPMSDLSKPMKYEFEGIKFFPSLSSIIINPKCTDKDSLCQSNELAVKILNKLHHTPVKAIGFNMSYKELDGGKAKSEIDEIEKITNNYGVPLSGFNQITVNRRIPLVDELNGILNISLEKTDSFINMMFNYHYPYNGNPENYQDRFTDNNDKAKQILFSNYEEEETLLNE